MLQNLHVKNLALIDECEVEFDEGLNILSGETGAGKSIIIGSINLALGEKVPKEMLRDNGQSAFVELIFSVENEDTIKKLRELDVENGRQYSNLKPQDNGFESRRKSKRGGCLCIENERNSIISYRYTWTA